jgi:glyoxylase-like metal-dependent hydrolase (beta-lactamase superfamily II)
MLVDNPPQQIADDFWMLGTAPYPLYLFRGTDEGTLFEGGTGAMGPVLQQQLDSLSIPRDYIRRVVLTHAHPDHVMALPLFRELFAEIEVLASAPAAKTLAAEKAMAIFGKLDDLLSGSLAKAGVIEEAASRPAYAEGTFAVDRLLSDGDTIAMAADATFHVLETPGHSDCSLSFWEPNRRLLLISDATGYFFASEGTWWPNYFTDYAAYVESIERLANCEADVLCLSHNAVITGAPDVAEYFRNALAATRAYHQQIVGAFQSGKTVREIAEQLGTEIYDKTPLLPLEFFQKNCSLLVKHSLAHEGLL